MSPVLQCPDCGYRHPLDRFNGAETFRCGGCDRLLKVPEQHRRVASSPPSAPAPVGVAPVTFANVTPRRPPGVPFVVRVGLWVVALPLSLWFVYRGARAVGTLDAEQVENLFFDTGWGRFWPFVRLLPFWALLCAGIVQLGVIGIGRWRRARADQRRRGTPGGRAQVTDEPRDPAPARTGS